MQKAPAGCGGSQNSLLGANIRLAESYAHLTQEYYNTTSRNVKMALFSRLERNSLTVASEIAISCFAFLAIVYSVAIANVERCRVTPNRKLDKAREIAAETCIEATRIYEH